MAEIDVTVCGRSYRLGCEDGQERRLAALAGALDAEARAVASQTGAMSESKVLLMAALVLADRADETEAALAAAQARLAQAEALEAELAALRDRARPAPGTPALDPAAAAALSDAVARLEALAGAAEAGGA